MHRKKLFYSKTLMLTFISVALAAVYLQVCQASVDSTVITISDGTQIRGVIKNKVTSFKGIPYALPPLNSLRWAPPLAWKNPDSSQVLDGSTFGNECKQTRAGVEKGSEDCLFLNVYTPANVTASGDLPVAFYIHGGSYTSGSGNDYDGTDFINFWDGQAVIVTINYRLNVFGFAGSEELRSRDLEAGSTGNYGIQDQRLAMRWVQDNIAAFGGNPQRVMIYGESAGAGSVSNHLARPASRGLFSSATLESGSFAEWITQPMSLAQTAYGDLAVATGCAAKGASSSPSAAAAAAAASSATASTTEDPAAAAVLQCLLALDTDSLYAPAIALTTADPNWGTPWNPTVDGVELITHPWMVLQQGEVADVPIMHGTNRDEGTMFYDRATTLDEAGLLAYWSSFHMYTEAQLAYLQTLYVTGQEYPIVEVPEGEPQPTVYWWAGMRWMGDLGFSCPARHASQELSMLQRAGKRSSGSYTYMFEYHANSSSVPYVQHTAEIPFVFHMHSYIDSPADLQVANVMSSYWGNFLTEHHPNDIDDTLAARKVAADVNRARLAAGSPVLRSPVDVPVWPIYVESKDDVNDIKGGTDIHMLAGMKEEECHFLNQFVSADIQAKFPTTSFTTDARARIGVAVASKSEMTDASF